MEDRKISIAYGRQATPADRIPWIRAARETAVALRAAGTRILELEMPDVGHDFPPDQMARLRQWINE